MIEIEFDPHGIARIPFPELRDRIALEGRRFTGDDLSHLPYHQIRLAAMANAGETACSIEEVVREKVRRRHRFVDSPDELARAGRYLASESMIGDVNAAIASRSPLKLENMTTLQKLWLKLNCLYNHTDQPGVRLREASNLVHDLIDEGKFDPELPKRFLWEIDHLFTYYPHALSVDQLRGKLGLMVEHLLEMMTDNEWVICDDMVVIEYSCTSDCYRPL